MVGDVEKPVTVYYVLLPWHVLGSVGGGADKGGKSLGSGAMGVGTLCRIE